MSLPITFDADGPGGALRPRPLRVRCQRCREITPADRARECGDGRYICNDCEEKNDDDD